MDGIINGASVNEDIDDSTKAALGHITGYLVRSEIGAVLVLS